MLHQSPNGRLCGCLDRNLFPEDFLHLADFLLDLPGYLFGCAFAFQVGIVRQLAHLFLNLALHFVGVPAISFSVLGFI